MEINGLSSEKAYSFETTGPRGFISDLCTPWGNTKRHIQNKVTVSLFLGQSSFFFIITNEIFKFPFINIHWRYRLHIYTQDALRQDLQVHVISLSLTVFSRSPHRPWKVFTHETFECGTKCHLWVLKIFINSLDTSIKKVPKTHEPDQFDLCQGHSSNRCFLRKSMVCTLKFMKF